MKSQQRRKQQPARQARPQKKPKARSPKKLTKPTEWAPYDWRTLLPAPIIGIDEAGRGCLAGPVVAAAVVLRSEMDLDLLTDSKLVSEPRREMIYEKIMSLHSVGVGFATAAEIDEINILQASFLAMRRALEALGEKCGHVIVDGRLKIPKCDGYKQTPLVKGDLRCKPVSAASIVAKVTRDRLMRELAKEFPDYGFEIHKGYGTAHHRAMLDENGPCREHRRSFRGVELENGLLLGELSEELVIKDGLVY